MAVVRIIGSLLLISLAAVGLVDAYGNSLMSGQFLATDQSLTSGNYSFVIQRDCNLVLYSVSGFQSDTHGRGDNCNLTLTNMGQLVVMDGEGNTIWSSPKVPSAVNGKYAAVLRQDGVAAIYGPRVWSTPMAPQRTPVSAAVAESKAVVGTTPLVKNMMFSGQVLSGDTRLAIRDKTLKISNCELSFNKGSYVVWRSGTYTPGVTCFARLDHEGHLSIVTDSYKILFETTSSSGAVGEYAVVPHGDAAIYGPMIWSTADGQ